jgi:hypothetical protein
VVAGLQLRQGLAVDGGRTYAEDSMTWLVWYLGPVVLVAAWLMFAGLAARSVRWWRSGSTAVPAWLAPAFIGFGSMVLTLYRPGITPDHPWADRRMVPLVLPAVVLAAGGALAWAGRTARRRWSASVLAAVLVTGVVAMLAPAWLATAPVADARTELGEPAAVRAVCAALHPGDAVVAVDARGANEWPQLLRAVCRVPAASIKAADDDVAVAALNRIDARITAAGYHPVLLAGQAEGVALIRQLRLEPTQVVDLRTSEDQRYLERRPDGVDPLLVQVWLARP